MLHVAFFVLLPYLPVILRLVIKQSMKFGLAVEIISFIRNIEELAKFYTTFPGPTT